MNSLPTRLKLYWKSRLKSLAAIPLGLLASCQVPAQSVEPPVAAHVVPSGHLPPKGGRLTLQQAINEALRSNPGVGAAAHQSLAAASDATAASRSRWGSLNAVGAYSYLNDDQSIRPVSSQMLAGGVASAPWDRSQAHYGLSYEVPLYLGGRLDNQIKIARLEARKAAELLTGTRWQVRFNVVSLYSTAQALAQAAAALDGQLAALTRTKTNLDEMVDGGKRPEVDRLKVIEDLEAAKSNRAAVGADQRRVIALLLSVLGRDPAGELVLDPQHEPPVGLARQSPSGVVDSNSIIRTASLTAEQAARGVDVARSEFLPKITASANVLENTGLRTDRNEESWGASVMLVFPLFDGGTRSAKLSAARAREAAAGEALRQVQLQTDAVLQDALAKFAAARTSLEAARARVAAGTEAARIEQTRYDTGAGTIEDLLRARSREEGAHSALALARANLVIAAERINTITEKPVIQ